MDESRTKKPGAIQLYLCIQQILPLLHYQELCRVMNGMSNRLQQHLIREIWNECRPVAATEKIFACTLILHFSKVHKAALVSLNVKS